MADKGGGEVLRDTCALTLGDEPLAGGVEHRAVELPVRGPEVGVALHHPINVQRRKEPDPGMAALGPTVAPVRDAKAPPALLPWT